MWRGHVKHFATSLQILPLLVMHLLLV